MTTRFVGLNLGHDAGVAVVDPEGRRDPEVFEVEKQTGDRHSCVGRPGAADVVAEWLERAAGHQPATNVVIGISDYSFVSAPTRPPALDALLRDPSWHTPEDLQNAVIRRLPDLEGWRFAPTVSAPVEAYSVRHHYAHAAAAYFTSPSRDAVVLALDGTGNFAESGLICVGSGDSLTPVFSLTNRRGPRCGLLYEAYARRLFATNFDTGKLMGLSAYGQIQGDLLPILAALIVDPAQRAEMPDLFPPITSDLDGCALRYGEEWIPYDAEAGSFWGDNRKISDEQVVERFGYAVPDAVRLSDGTEVLTGERADEHTAQNFAATLDIAVQQCIVELCAGLRQRFPHVQDLCFAGGCALNISANSRLVTETGFRAVHIPTCCDDSGIALGAALAVAHGTATRTRGGVRPAWHETAYAGPSVQGPRTSDGRYSAPDSVDELIAAAARALAEGRAIGWVEGGVETGPRALGHRSLLISPHIPGARRRVSEEIKQREWFRPVAPLCLEEDAADLFSGPIATAKTMLFACKVRGGTSGWRREVGHVDGSARLQTVSRAVQPHLAALIAAVGGITGVPVLINTSLNRGGRAIANTYAELELLVESTPLDAIYLVDEKLVLAASVHAKPRARGWEVVTSG